MQRSRPGEAGAGPEQGQGQEHFGDNEEWGKITQEATCTHEVRAIPHSPETQLGILNCILSPKERKKMA